MMNKKIIFLFSILTLGILVSLEPLGAFGQWWDRGYRNYQLPERDIFPGNSFTFCRIQYESQWGGRGRGRGGRGGSWDTDYPESDLNFPQRLSELTTINVNRDEN